MYCIKIPRMYYMNFVDICSNLAIILYLVGRGRSLVDIFFGQVIL